MEKAEHAERLRAAMASRGVGREFVVDATGASQRTITNWTTGANLPKPADREKLRVLFPGYDTPGDRVEVAIMASELTEDRRFHLVGVYKRLLREQREGVSASG